MLNPVTRAKNRLGGLRRDDLFRRLARNVGYLLFGSLGASILGLGSLALTARTLGPTLLGVLVMIEAYTRIVDWVLRPESWQALIKYGTETLERREDEAFARLIKFGVLIDLGGAVLATVVAIGGIRFAGSWMGWDEQTVLMGSIYSLVLLANLRDTPTALLRLFDRFNVFAWRLIMAAALRLALVAVAFSAGMGLWAFIAIGMIVSVTESLLMIAAAWMEFRRRGFLEHPQTRPLRGVTSLFPGIWGFIWSNNLSLLMRKTTQEFDILLVGSLAGPAAAGLYHVAKRLGEMVMKIGRPLQQAVYPDAARLWAKGEITRFKRTIMTINLLSGGAAALVLLVLLFQKEPILRLIAGEVFVDAAMPLVVYMAAMSLMLCGIALRPALFSMGRQQALLGVVTISAIAFYLCLFATIPTFGALGASLAHLVFNAIWLTGALTLFFQGLAKSAGGPMADESRAGGSTEGDVRVEPTKDPG